MDDKDKATTTETPPVVADAGEPTEPIEIDVGAPDGDEPPAEPAPKKKTGGRLQAKIDHERALRGQAETAAQRLHRENEELKAQLEETQRKHQQADQAALANYEESVKGKLENAKRAHAEAIDSGDSKRIADTTAEVSKWAAEDGRIEQFRKRQPQADEGGDDEPPARTEPQRQQPQAQQQPAQFTPEMRGFLDTNPWFVPNTSEFNIEMHQFARQFGATLERRYQAEGKKIDAAYYEEVARKTKAAFDYEEDDGEEEAEPAPPPARKAPRMNGDQNITPARATQVAPGAPQPGGGNKITLTPEQRGFARSLVDGGAYKKPDGTPLTYAEAEVRYAKALHKDQQNQAQRRA